MSKTSNLRPASSGNGAALATVINASLNPLKKLLHLPPNVLVTMQALPRPLLLEIDKALPYKL
jgi:hypothetical protein